MRSGRRRAGSDNAAGNRGRIVRRATARCRGKRGVVGRQPTHATKRISRCSWASRSCWSALCGSPIPSETAGRAQALAGEIRRTIAAVRQQLDEQQVSRVILCGIAAEADGAANLASDLGLTVDVFDVAENAPSGLAKTGLSPESIARFAAVMGMALGEADRRPPVVDFLNVRRRTAERKFTRQHALAVAAAAVVLLAFGTLLWKRSHDLNAQIARVNADTVEQQNQFKTQQLDKSLADAAAIESWLATDVNWLDELDRLSTEWRPKTLDSKEYPVAEDAVITQLIAFRPPGNNVAGGRMSVQAVARSPQVVATLEARLRDERHQVDTGGGRTDRTVPGYLWSIPFTVDIAPADGRRGVGAMTNREKILAAAVAAIVLLWGGGRMWTRYNASIAERRTQLLAAEERLGQARLALAQGQAAIGQIDDWKERSLPTDREAAQSLYRVWLETQFKAAGLTVEEFQPAQRLTPAAGYTAIGYTINAHGPLKSLTNFMHAYYRSPLLQQITRLQLRPDTNPQQLKISLQTEALILAGAANETIPEGVAERSAKAKASDYAESIGGRNVFTVYRAPRPNRRRPRPASRRQSPSSTMRSSPISPRRFKSTAATRPGSTSARQTKPCGCSRGTR